jgi:hypothetical protein
VGYARETDQTSGTAIVSRIIQEGIPMQVADPGTGIMLP